MLSSLELWAAVACAQSPQPTRRSGNSPSNSVGSSCSRIEADILESEEERAARSRRAGQTVKHAEKNEFLPHPERRPDFPANASTAL